jgi:hypothetical protein
MVLPSSVSLFPAIYCTVLLVEIVATNIESKNDRSQSQELKNRVNPRNFMHIEYML